MTRSCRSSSPTGSSKREQPATVKASQDIPKAACTRKGSFKHSKEGGKSKQFYMWRLRSLLPGVSGQDRVTEVSNPYTSRGGGGKHSLLASSSHGASCHLPPSLPPSPHSWNWWRLRSPTSATCRVCCRSQMATVGRRLTCLHWERWWSSCEVSMSVREASHNTEAAARAARPGQWCE